MSGFGDWMYRLVHVPWWTTARVTATVAAVALIGGLTTAIIAIRSFRHAQRDSRSRTRPMMSAELKIVGNGILNLVIKNGGASIAKNVVVSFDPPLPNGERSPDGQGNVARLVNMRYANAIPVWVPSREMENFYWIRDDSTPDEDPQSVDGVPALVTATIAYGDDQGRAYIDVFPLNEREFNGAAMPIKTETTSSRQTIGARRTVG